MFIGMNGAALYGGGYTDDLRYDEFWKVGVWHHICLTYDGATAKLYADAQLVASAAKDWRLVLNRAYIGRQVNDAGEFWDGAVDDVRVYRRVLSPGEVKDIVEGRPVLNF
jgi:sialidase-1